LQSYFTQRWGINLAPTDITLSANSIPEDSPSGTTIGTLSTTDPEDTVFTYSIETGTGDEDNARFTISGNELKLNFVPDYEIPIDVGDTALNNTYTVRIGTNDGNGNTYEESFIITVLDTTGAAPTDISLTSSTVDENSAINTAVGTLSTTDSDSSSFTYTIQAGT